MTERGPDYELELVDELGDVLSETSNETGAGAADFLSEPSNESPSSTADPMCLDWFTLEEAREWWRDAPYDDAELSTYLEVGKSQIIAYGPQLVADEIAMTGCVPENYRLGQIMQARNLWNAAKMDPAGSIGGDGFSFQPFPLDWTVKQIIRPKTARAVVQ